MREKVTGIKENYDKKFEDLFKQFKEIETLFLNGYFEEETLGDIKNSKQKQKEVIDKATGVLTDLDKLKREITSLKQNQNDFEFFSFENVRGSLE